jgi:hypothetical protein
MAIQPVAGAPATDPRAIPGHDTDTLLKRKPVSFRLHDD